MAGGAEFVITAGVKLVVRYEDLAVIESFIGFESALYLIGMTFTACNPPFAEGLGVGGGKSTLGRRQMATGGYCHDAGHECNGEEYSG
jgi:hypothetical protein